MEKEEYDLLEDLENILSDLGFEDVKIKELLFPYADKTSARAFTTAGSVSISLYLYRNDEKITLVY